jgi:transcriptional regulator with XRE-family HTH domain
MTLLDTRVLIERRLANGLSQSGLAKALGLPSAQAVRALKRGTNHEQWTLHQLARLAETLGLAPAELFSRPPPPTEPTEAELKVEAALALAGKKLHRDDLARAFAWTLEGAGAACRRLRTRRASAGQRVHYSRGRWG